MAAIVTDSLRKEVGELLFDNSTSGRFYIGIGKSDTYDSSDNTITPIRTKLEDRRARENLLSVRKVNNTSFVIPRYNWTSGTTYAAYADNYVGIPSNSYYVLNEDNEVYVCLQTGRTSTGATNPSTVKPSYTAAGVAARQAFETSDGYRWKLLYSLSAARATTFLTSGFIPIQNVDSATASGAFELEQLQIQNTTYKGGIIGVRIVDGGAGYTGSTTAVTFSGNGTGASATATISGGAIVKVEMDNESGGMGSGYDYASAVVTGDATLEPIIASQGGIGSDPLNELKASAVMFNVKNEGTEGNTHVIGQDFRQITLFKDMKLDDSAADGPFLKDQAYKVGRFIDLTIASSGLSADQTLIGDTDTITAHIDEIDSNGSGNERIHFHQNEKHKKGEFAAAEQINSNTAIIDGNGEQKSPVNTLSGELLYIENRTKVARSSDQTEDIKIIITV